MTLPDTESLLFAEQRGVFSITLHRPKARNAMTLAMVRALTEAIRHADAAPGLRALVVRGAGGHFSAGADVKDFARARIEPVTPARDPVVELNAAFGALCLAFADTSLPTLCALEGAVLGGGFGLACTSDITLAAASASFGLPETSLGVVPAQIAPFLAGRLGLQQAQRLAILGGRIDAHAAKALGLVHEVYADSAALQVGLEEHLERILACAPEATRATKRLFQRMRAPASVSVDEAAQVFAAALRSDEGEEGTRAFTEKRPPRWRQT